jgi:hypothetical protein
MIAKQRGKYSKKHLGGDVTKNVVIHNSFSTQPNIDPSYTEQGIYYRSMSSAKNVGASTFSSISNIMGVATNFGDNNFFSELWNKCIIEIDETIKKLHTADPKYNFRIVNVKFEFVSIDINSLTINTYGTIISKPISSPLTPTPTPTTTTTTTTTPTTPIITTT